MRTQSRLGGTHLLADAPARLPPGCMERWGSGLPPQLRGALGSALGPEQSSARWPTDKQDLPAWKEKPDSSL